MSLLRQKCPCPRSQIINIHGCFWHMHACQRRRREPVNHAEYWRAKRAGNAARDRRILRELRRQGWDVLIVWECQTRDVPAITKRLTAFLSRPVKDKLPRR